MAGAARACDTDSTCANSEWVFVLRPCDFSREHSNEVAGNRLLTSDADVFLFFQL